MSNLNLQRPSAAPRSAARKSPRLIKQPSVTAHLMGCTCSACWTDWVAYGCFAIGVVPLLAYDIVVRGGAGILAAIGWN